MTDKPKPGELGSDSAKATMLPFSQEIPATYNGISSSDTTRRKLIYLLDRLDGISPYDPDDVYNILRDTLEVLIKDKRPTPSAPPDGRS